MAEKDKSRQPARKHPRLHRASDAAALMARVPPQAVEVEQAVLGALLLDRDAFHDVMDILTPDSFYDERHGMIYKAMVNLFTQSRPIDVLTVADQLARQGELEAAGGRAYLSELSLRVASSANIEHHARIIAQKHMMRELIHIATEVLQDAYSDTTDVFDLLDKVEQHLYEVTTTNLKREYDTASSLASQLLSHLEELRKKTDGLTGVPSGYPSLDRVTSGFQPSDLIIVAARPAMGKTAFVLNVARNVAMEYKKAVAVFSLEMASLQLMQRLLAMQSRVKGTNIRNGKLDEAEWQQVVKAIEELSEAPIFIDDTPGINIFELRAKCRRLKSKHDIQLIIIDYLQLMSGGPDTRKGNREQEISSISRALKGLAKELNVPVIALSQLSRAVETRGGEKRPQLSDLRESGAIEQDADIVSFLYRPDYYGMTESEEGESLVGITELIIAKHRNGPTETIKLRFENEIGLFNEPTDPFLGGGDFSEAFDSGAGFIQVPSKMNTDTLRPDPDEEVPF